MEASRSATTPPHVVFDDRGLVVAIAQDRLTGQIRMVAWMNREALAATFETGNATFFSRSRSELWTKGETSGNVLRVSRVLLDCDGDTLLLETEPAGPSCHTGRPTCFFRELGTTGALAEVPAEPGNFLERLEEILLNREQSSGERSYTKALLEGGASKIGEKLNEEAAELAAAIDHESEARVVAEAADVIYHLMVGLRLRGVAFRTVLTELDRRTGQSGFREKANRR